MRYEVLIGNVEDTAHFVAYVTNDRILADMIRAECRDLIQSHIDAAAAAAYAEALAAIDPIADRWAHANEVQS
jgi:hypothetical protein